MTEIPEDIIEAAELAYQASAVKVSGKTERAELIGAIARAILAERGRCFHVTNREWGSCDYTDIFDGYQVAALRDAADRIRSGLHMHEFRERKRENV